MGLDFITSDVPWPILLLFNQGAHKDNLFPQLDDPFQHTKAAVKDNNKTQVKNIGTSKSRNTIQQPPPDFHTVVD